MCNPMFDRATLTLRIVAMLALATTLVPADAQIAVRNQGYIPFSDAPINYRSNDLHDPVDAHREG